MKVKASGKRNILKEIKYNKYKYVDGLIMMKMITDDDENIPSYIIELIDKSYIMNEEY